MNRTCGSFGLVMLMFASSAMAQSRTQMLKGDFAFTSSVVCVLSPAIITPTSYTPPAGFSPALVPLGFSFVITFGAQGVRTFNGDGTGSFTQRAVSLGNPGAASATDNSGQFTYSVAADRTLTIDDGPIQGVFVAGPRVGQQVSASNIPTLIGRVSSDGRSLTFASFNPGVEIFTRLVPGPELVESLRICHRAANGIRISRTPGSDGHEDD
jgi:hypothetical protein